MIYWLWMNCVPVERTGLGYGKVGGWGGSLAWPRPWTLTLWVEWAELTCWWWQRCRGPEAGAAPGQPWRFVTSERGDLPAVPRDVLSVHRQADTHTSPPPPGRVQDKQQQQLHIVSAWINTSRRNDESLNELKWQHIAFLAKRLRLTAVSITVSIPSPS